MRSLAFVLAAVLPLCAFNLADAQLPDAAATFVVHVDGQGSLSVDGGATPADDASVMAQASAALRRDAATVLVVEGESEAPYQAVVRAAQLLQQSGAKQISFRTVVAANID